MVVIVPQSCKPFLREDLLLFKRPNLLFTCLVTIPSVIFFGSLVLVFGVFSRGKIGWMATFCNLNWGRWMLWAHSVNTHIEGPGLKNLSSLKGVVFVSNHQSLLDIPVLFKYLPAESSFIAKRELFHIPLFGWAAYFCGTIFIDRARGAQNRSLSSVTKYLNEGRSIIMFPEGTRSPTGELGNFKRGAFVFAIQAQVPIVPISILNTRDLLPKGKLAAAPGDVRIFVDRPIQTTGMNLDDRLALAEKVREMISRRLSGELN